MKIRKEDLDKKLISFLRDEVTSAKELAKKMHCCVGTIYTAIRRARREGKIGIIPGKGGYVLSEFAKEKDIVHFLRRVNGRRTCDLIAVETAYSDIVRICKKHFNIDSVLEPLVQNHKLLEKSSEVLDARILLLK